MTATMDPSRTGSGSGPAAGQSAPAGVGLKFWGALLIVYVVWGSTYFAIRILVSTAPPMLFSGVRYLGAGLVLAAILFSIGAVGVLVRRNAIVVFMCVELMLNSVNLTLVTFARASGTLDGQVIAFFVMVVAAAEVVVGLAIIMSIYRTRRSASVDDANLLKY